MRWQGRTCKKLVAVFSDHRFPLTTANVEEKRDIDKTGNSEIQPKIQHLLPAFRKPGLLPGRTAKAAVRPEAKKNQQNGVISESSLAKLGMASHTFASPHHPGPQWNPPRPWLWAAPGQTWPAQAPPPPWSWLFHTFENKLMGIVQINQQTLHKIYDS